MTEVGTWWPYLVILLDVAVSLYASAHVLLNKRDPRSAVMWIALAWMVPFFGAALYALLGVNRVQRRAALLFPGRAATGLSASSSSVEALRDTLKPDHEHLSALVQTVDSLVREPIITGNRIDPLCNGDEAYPAMLEAIEQARHSIALCSYIFDNDAAGDKFCNALERAVARGVAVRVLIDDIGRRYSWPRIDRRLRRQGVPCASFLPTWMPANALVSNLRNHRKILVVDGRIGFTGGLNIRQGHILGEPSPHPVADVHFRLEGPVVAELLIAFAEDWAMTTGEMLQGPLWFPPLEPAGNALARGILDGPDENFDVLRLLYLAALVAAKRSVRIVTPYFVPERSLIMALGLCALRGVKVEIVLPSRNNIRIVQWAQNAMLWQVLIHGCRVFFTPEPFDHSKLLLIDDLYVLFGSANWDARSLRLNFEFNVESYDPELARRVKQIIDDKVAAAREVTLEEVDGRSLPVRLRDGVARLLTPYL